MNEDLLERTEAELAMPALNSLPAVGFAPSTPLTPMQMAYQLAARGTDIATIKEMLEVGRSIEKEQAERQFNSAMADAQAEMQVVLVNKDNTQTKSMYATYDQIDRAMRPIYSKHGFALSFDEADCPKPECIRIICMVSHRDGFSRTYHRDMPANGKGAKGGDVMSTTHAAGAAASYGMRYILRGVFNVAVGEEDRDGNKVDAPLPSINDEQQKELLALIKEAGTTVERFCEIGKIDALVDLPAAGMDNARRWLRERIAARKAKGAPVTPNFDKLDTRP